MFTDPTPWTDLGAAWLLTYVFHSTLLLGGTWFIARRLRNRRDHDRDSNLGTREALWKTALLGGLVTATLQLGLGWQPALGTWQLGSSASSPGMEATAGTSRAEHPGRLEGRLSASSREVPAHVPAMPPGDEGREAVSSPGPVLPPSATAASPSSRVLSVTPASSTRASDSLTTPWPLPRWTAAVTGLWLLGALVLGGSLFVSYRGFCHRIRSRAQVVGGGVRRLFDALQPAQAVGRPVALSASSRLQSPLAKGVTRPEICLPVRALSELSEEQQQTLLAHELGHLVRRDPAWLLAARTIESLLFLQPLNRLARRRLQEISELRADDWAVTATGKPLDLARCLTRVADWNLTPLPVPAMAEKGSGLTRRVHRLLRERGSDRDRPARSLWLAAGAVLLTVALVAPGVAAVGGGSSPPPEAPPAPEAPEAPEPSEAPEPPATPEAPEPTEAPEAPEAPEALEAPEAAEAPRAPEAPPATAPAPEAPAPETPAPETPSNPRPPRIAPIPSVPVAPPASDPPHLAWLGSPPRPEEPPRVRPRIEGLPEEMSAEERRALEAALAEALAPLEEIHQVLAEGVSAEVERALQALDLSATVLSENELTELADAQVLELNAELEAMNAALAEAIDPQFELQLETRLPELEELTAVHSAELARLADETRRLAEDGALTEQEAAELREQARRLAEEMRPQREELERVREEARRMARQAREQVLEQTRELRRELREQQRQQMDELRQHLEELRQEQGQEMRQRLEAQREAVEQIREQIRRQVRQQIRQQREVLRQEHQEQQERQRQIEREREEHRRQMEEHRRELERRREQESEGEEGQV